MIPQGLIHQQQRHRADLRCILCPGQRSPSARAPAPARTCSRCAGAQGQSRARGSSIRCNLKTGAFQIRIARQELSPRTARVSQEAPTGKDSIPSTFGKCLMLTRLLEHPLTTVTNCHCTSNIQPALHFINHSIYTSHRHIFKAI